MSIEIMEDKIEDVNSNCMTEDQKKAYDGFIEYMVLLYSEFACLLNGENQETNGPAS